MQNIRFSRLQYIQTCTTNTPNLTSERVPHPAEKPHIQQQLLPVLSTALGNRLFLPVLGTSSKRNPTTWDLV